MLTGFETRQLLVLVLAPVLMEHNPATVRPGSHSSRVEIECCHFRHQGLAQVASGNPSMEIADTHP